MIKKMVFGWEEIQCTEDNAMQTIRARVIGGWIVKSLTQQMRNKIMCESMVFVPDRDHEWTLMKPLTEQTLETKKTVSASDFESTKK